MSKSTKARGAGETSESTTEPAPGATAGAPSAGDVPPAAQAEGAARAPAARRTEHPEHPLYRVGVGYTLLFPGVGAAMQPWARSGEYLRVDNAIVREDLRGQEHKLELVDTLPEGAVVVPEERLHPGQLERLRRHRLIPRSTATAATAAAAALGSSAGAPEIPSARAGLTAATAAKGTGGQGT